MGADGYVQRLSPVQAGRELSRAFIFLEHRPDTKIDIQIRHSRNLHLTTAGSGRTHVDFRQISSLARPLQTIRRHITACCPEFVLLSVGACGSRDSFHFRSSAEHIWVDWVSLLCVWAPAFCDTPSACLEEGPGLFALSDLECPFETVGFLVCALFALRPDSWIVLGCLWSDS